MVSPITGVRPLGWILIRLLFYQSAGCIDPRTAAGRDIPAPNEACVCVDLLNEVGKLLDDVLEGFVSHWIDSLDRQRLHEALGLCVVVGIASAPHGAYQAMFGKELAVDLGGIL